MMCLSRPLRHKLRDRGGNLHNFAFDTMTKVYRESVYEKDVRYVGNPMYPEVDGPLPTHTAGTSTKTGTSAAAAVSFSGDLEATQVRVDKGEAVVNSSVSSKPSSATMLRPRRSGVQLEILSLYHDLLKETRNMKDPQTRENLRRFIRSEFNANVDIPRRCVTRIEWQLHYGKNKLEELRGMRPDTKFTLVQ